MKKAFIFEALGNSASMWQRRDHSFSRALLRFPGCIFLHHTYTHVAIVAKFLLPSTTLPPCTPSTRRALLFYYSTRPRRVRLAASAYIPGDLSSLPLLPSPPLSSPRFSTNGETGISAREDLARSFATFSSKLVYN